MFAQIVENLSCNVTIAVCLSSAQARQQLDFDGRNGTGGFEMADICVWRRFNLFLDFCDNGLKSVQ